MIRSRWLQPPRGVLTTFVAVVVACVGALAWLGARLLQQDRALQVQRIQEQLEVAADRAAALLGQRLAELERLRGDSPADALPGGIVLVVASADRIDVRGSPQLLFRPQVQPPRREIDGAIRAAERLEFQQNDPLAAAAVLRKAARSQDAQVRAEALVRLGRTLRKAGRTPEALDAYSDLAALGATPVSGLPAELVAQEARCSALEASGDVDALRREAAALLRELDDGRWPLTRSAYEYRASEARRWAGDPDQPPRVSEAMALSDAVEDLVRRWRERPEESRGRQVYRSASSFSLAVWYATANLLTASVAGPGYHRALWEEAIGDSRMRLALTGAAGETVFGTLPGSSERVAVRPAAVTRLPWTLHVSASDPAALASNLAARRRLLLAGVSILAVLLAVAGGFVVRSVTRELAVAGMQSDFVASVSHEFRSPLTSIRQLSSLLVQDRLPSDEQRRRSYAFLANETGRLERLVEGLLDFGLMEAGEAKYRMEPTDATALVRNTVEAFRPTVAPKGYEVELSVRPAVTSILADRDALGRAIWNLLDNAVKYSPDTRTVRVEVAERGGRVEIAVSDAGMGIPAAEQGAVFRKFVRGAGARQAGIKGTGIGLSMVRHIVAAHGGEVRLESAPGRGSTFTIDLPTEQRP
jgi:signal transduction histidine kinase